MDRRNFIESVFASGGLALTPNLPWLPFDTKENSNLATAAVEEGEFEKLTRHLLADWCEGMVRHQIKQPAKPQLHGALACPACDRIHGRCSDALYPFLHMAKKTDDPKYLTAAINVYNWAERNVSQDDGSWRNDIAPKAWRGTTIFGAIALAEALHYHGELLDDKLRDAWTTRLDRAAGGYLYRDFKSIDFTNLNYGMTGVYGFYLFGRLLNNQKYIARSKEFVARVKDFFTQPNSLLWGEGKPNNNRSARGLLPVDLGYNVEESLNGVVLYALEVDDAELLELMKRSLSGHLEFMLPDGAWDNSWGTRSQKWSYWGSRTSDGCQPAFGLMAGYNPAFGTAAIKNAELLKRCTSDGLLHGGPHYVSHGVKPCIHHTFTHAKVMALIQDKLRDKDHAVPKINSSTPLPRVVATGVKHFPELDVWLVGKGPWRGTVSAYDSIYKTKKVDHLQQPTGGSLAVLYHNQVGLLLAGSMARYIMVEPLNMQPQPNEDFPLTTRVETRKGNLWYSNLYDLEAGVTFKEDGNSISFEIGTTLQDEDRQFAFGGQADPSKCELRYEFKKDQVTISARQLNANESPNPVELVIPIISSSDEKVRRISKSRIEIEKPRGTVVIECSGALKIKETAKGRVFNMVPGAEAIPIIVSLPRQGDRSATCAISVV